LPSKEYLSKRHDTAIRIPVTLTPPANATWHLQTPGTTATFIARVRDATTPKVQGEMVITGEWTAYYEPTSTDVDTIGLFDVEVEVFPSGGPKKITFPTDDPGTANALTWRIGTDLNNT
jgi:hypothetical protein